MTTLNVLLISALVLLASSVQAAPSSNCSTQYQHSLQQTLDLRESCSDAVYKDCSEVSKILIVLECMQLHVY